MSFEYLLTGGMSRLVRVAVDLCPGLFLWPRPSRCGSYIAARFIAGMQTGGASGSGRDRHGTAIVPALQFDGKELPCYSFQTLSNLGRTSLQTRTRDLRDIIGQERCPHMNIGSPSETIVRYVIDIQCAVAKLNGLDLTPADFGAPSRGAAPLVLTELEIQRLAQARVDPAVAQAEPERTLEIGLQKTDPRTARLVEGYTLSSREEYVFRPEYLGAHADASAAARAVKQMHQGTLGSFMFSEPVVPEADPTYAPNPPFQIAPPDWRPGTVGTSIERSTYTSQYQHPPSACYRNR